MGDVYVYKNTEYFCKESSLWRGSEKFSCTLSDLKVSSKLLDLPEMQYVNLYRQSENYYLIQ